MELTLDPVGGVWLAWAAALGMLAAPWLLPPRGAGLTPARRRWLQGLRTAATLALLFAWARPTVVRVRTEALRPALVLLVDGSRSMSVADSLDGASRWEATRRLLGASGPALARLAKNVDVRPILFDRGVVPIEISDGLVALPESPVGEETALGAALADALAAVGGDALAGVVLISDGAQRARPPRDAPALASIGRLTAEGVPLYGVAVGERLAADQPDLAIEDLVVSDTAFAGAPLDVAASLRVTGYPNRTVRVRLLWEGTDGAMAPVDAVEVVLRQGVESYPLALRYAPPAAGEWKLSVAADTLEGETLADNNAASTFVSVREGGVRVLVVSGATRVGGAPGLEQRFLRAALAESPDLAVERVVVNYVPLRRELADRFAPGAADVVFLDNVDADGLSLASWRALATLIDRGAGLAMIGGRQSFGPGGHRDTLGDALPITPGRAERQQLDAPLRADVHLAGPLRMVPTAAGPIVDLPRDGSPSGDSWARLPPLAGANRLGGTLKPNARVLATTDGPRPEPLLVIGSAGLGRTLAFAGDSTWRWVLAGEGDTHRRFWRQAVLWLAKKDDDPSARVIVDLGARRVPAGSRLDFEAGVRGGDSSAEAAIPIRYEARVTRPDGSAGELPLPGSGARVAGVVVDTAQPGDYRVRVEAFRLAASLGAAESRFLVPRRDLELERPGAEPDTLGRLAEATAADGGRLVALEELPALFAELAAKPPVERSEVVSRTTLYDKWPLLAVFAALMTAEWLVRRRAGLP